MKSVVIYVILFLSLVDEMHLSLRVPRLKFICPNAILKNGNIRKRQRGRIVKFVCNPGYMLAGERYSTCPNGRFDPPPPKCVRATCMNKPNPPTNGLIYPTHSGAALHIYCKAGYDIRGPTDIYCDGRKWDNNMPVCLPSQMKPKLSCGFEEEDICGWSHDLNHDFDWRRNNYDTPSGSIGTGPTFDHTKGQGQDGYYMYIESSSRSENDTAKLISPIFDKTTSETCLEFFYHMFGATTGTLRAYVKRISEDWTLNPQNAVFSKTGNQGNHWFRSYHSLGVIPEDYQIIIEGVRGPGYVSDIAVDDVKIIEDCVYEEPTTVTEMAYSTEILATVESCMNRCGHKANGTEPFVIACDCDENCYDNSRCCPDYLDNCVSATVSEDYLSTTDMPTETMATTLAKSYTLSSFGPIVSSKKPLPISQKPIYTTTTARTTTISPTTTRRIAMGNTTRRITTRGTTTKLTTTSRRTTSKGTTVRPKTITKVTPETRPTIRILTQPTQTVIVERKITTLRPKNNTTPVVYKKPENVDTNDKDSASSDVMEVPRPTNSDEDESLMEPPLLDNKENWSEEDRFDMTFKGDVKEKDKFLSVKEPQNGSINVVLAVISIVGGTVLITVIGVIVIRRYKYNHRRMASANGDSQSDVRFLTSDEVLDFSLDRDYDTL